MALLIYVIYEILLHYQIGTNIKIIETTFYYIVPYGFLTFLGYNYNKTSKTTKYSIILTSLIIFITLVIYYYLQNGQFQSVQFAKYPPRAYYLSYGIAISYSLLMACEKVKQEYFNSKVINFISTHSMWLYLWHIIVLAGYITLHLPELWFLKLLIVYGGTILIVIIVNKILDFIEKNKKYKLLIYLRG